MIPSTRSSDLSPPQLNQHILSKNIDSLLKRIEEIKNKKIVLFFGASSAGKSTAINLLSGKELIKKSIAEITGNPNRKGYALVLKNPNDPDSAKIGNDKIAETIYHSLQTSSNGSYLLCDCPGYNDTRGTEIEVAVNIATKMLAENVSGLSLVVCLELPSLISSRGEAFRNCFNSLRNLFHTWDHDFNESLLILVTHNFDHQYTKENLMAELRSFDKVEPNLISFITRQEGEYIQLFTEKDKEDERGMRETATAIHTIINGLKYIKVNKARIGNSLTERAKNDLKNAFGGTINEANSWLTSYFNATKELPHATAQCEERKLSALKALKTLKEEIGQPHASLNIEMVTDLTAEIRRREEMIDALKNDDSDFTPTTLRQKVRIPISYITEKKRPPPSDVIMSGLIATGVGYAIPTIPVVAEATGPVVIPLVMGLGGLGMADYFGSTLEKRVNPNQVATDMQLLSEAPLRGVKKQKLSQEGSFEKEDLSEDNKNYHVMFITPSGEEGEASIEGVVPKCEHSETKRLILILTLEKVYLSEKLEQIQSDKKLLKLNQTIEERKNNLEGKEASYNLILLLDKLLSSNLESIITDQNSMNQFTCQYHKFTKIHQTSSNWSFF